MTERRGHHHPQPAPLLTISLTTAKTRRQRVDLRPSHQKVTGSACRRPRRWDMRVGCGSQRARSARIAGLFDEQVQAFRQRPLEGRYPYVFVDAKIDKVRDGGWGGPRCERLRWDVLVAEAGVGAGVVVALPGAAEGVIGTMLLARISIAWHLPSVVSHALHFRRPESTTLPLARLSATHRPMAAQIVTLKNCGRLIHSPARSWCGRCWRCASCTARCRRRGGGSRIVGEVARDRQLVRSAVARPDVHSTGLTLREGRRSLPRLPSQVRGASVWSAPEAIAGKGRQPGPWGQ